MHCLYCGKEIGALRLLRDREFCSASHRKSYKDRLGRVLHQIAGESKSPPPPPAGFLLNVSPSGGNIAASIALWQSGRDYPMRGIAEWTVAMPELAHLQPRELRTAAAASAEGEPAPVFDWLQETAYPELNLQAEANTPGAAESGDAGQTPPACTCFCPEPGPDVAERWLDRSLAAPYATVAALAAPPFNGLVLPALRTTPELAACMPVPTVEAVAAWVQPAASAEALTTTPALFLPTALDGVLLEAGDATPELAACMPMPAAEAVAAWVQPAASVEALATTPAVFLPAALDGVVLDAGDATPELAACMPAPAAEAVAAWVQPAASVEALATTPALFLPAALDGVVLDAGDATPELAACMPVPAAEAVAAWLQPAASVEALATTPAVFLPAALDGVVLEAGDATPELAACMPVPAAEAVAAWLQPAASVEALATTPALFLPAALDGVVLDAGDATPELAACMPAPAAEPVAAWVQPAASVEALATTPALFLPAALDVLDAGDATPELAACMPALAAEAVAAWVQPAASVEALATTPAVFLPAPLGLIDAVELPSAAVEDDAPGMAASAPAPTIAAAARVPAAPALPGLAIVAELEPLAEPDALVEIPALCEALMSAPQAQPVWSFLIASSAAEFRAEMPQARPVFAAEISGTHIPMATSLRPLPKPEPVMAGVWPRIAETQLDSMDAFPAFFLPASAGPAARPLSPAAAAAAWAPAPEPVETLLVASQAAQPARAALPLQLPAIAALDTVGADRALARPAAVLEPEVVESWIAAASAGPAAAAAPVVLQPFQLAGYSPAAIPALDRPALAAGASQPAPAAGKVVQLQPLATVRVTLPGPQQRRTIPVIPQPGMMAIEYHAHRTRGAAFARPEWKSVQYEPLPPNFSLHAILERPEDLIKPKTAPAGIFPINTRNTRTRSAIMEHILRVAAAVLIVTTIWFGAAAMKNARRINVRQDETAFATPNRVLTPESQQAVRSKAEESKGPLQWMRQTVASRASVQVGEDFQGDMRNWGAGPGTLAANWRRHPDGYMQTGALALFAPTRNFSDYKLEFFGQIESKSVGWVVRAKDDKNYHAMKFTMLEAGLRPIIAMVHYDVVDGKPGHRTQTPLNVMVHNNTPFQVAVTVSGKHFVTSVDGEEVDNYREDAMPTGGVGFFSDAGEHARLYWARVTKNDDWLGHVCAFLSGGESRATAELWPRSVPPGMPVPGTPSDNSSLLAAAWIGLPTLRRTQFPRRNKRCNR